MDLGEWPVERKLAAALERAGNEAYADGKVAFFFVSYTAVQSQPEGVCAAAHAGLKEQHPKLVLVCRETRSQATSARADGVPYGHAKLREQQSAFASAYARGDDAALLEAARGLVRLGEKGPPPRSAQEVFDDVYTAHTFSFWGGLGGLGLAGFIWLRRWNRYRSRTCRGCGRARQLLGPRTELEHLDAAQKREQEVGSVDYDVWWCGVCHDVWINDNVAWFSGYSRCPSCSSRTRRSATTTLHHATEWSHGLVEVKEWCAHCNYSNVYTRTTARLSSSSDSSWGSSSSSSSDSSFGGGSSSGDGSSGSW